MLRRISSLSRPLRHQKPPQSGAQTRVFASAQTQTNQDFHDMVQTYYGKTLSTSKDLKTSACCAASAPPLAIRNALLKVPDEIKSKFYGCGSPLPFGINGLSVLDLGSGSGQDCYVASQLVGQEGSVVGVDMTDEQLQVAKNHIESFSQSVGYSRPNLRFEKGYIEMLGDAGVEPESIDLVISNCVVNLSPAKDQVLQGVWDSMKWGGEFYFSDVYCDRRLPKHITEHEVLVGECLGGALYVEDFRRLCQDVGFSDPRILSVDTIAVEDKELAMLLGNAKFYSITYRLFKVEGIEDKCEDFGQVATYRGSIGEHPHFYDLDDHHRFYTNKPMLVCGNTALMVGSSWLGKHFEVQGDFSTHYGLFDCGPIGGAANAPADVGGACC